MGKYRQPWHLHLKDDGLMGFAGLWEERSDAENFTIVSAPANVVVARVIDRMPVILPQTLWRPWLNPEKTMQFHFRRFCPPLMRTKWKLTL